MPVSMEFLRGVLGLIGIGCAFMAGRSAAALRKGWEKKSRLYGWIIRMAACMVAVSLRHPFDATDTIVWLLAAACFALGYWNTSRERREEDLAHTIFPDQS